MISNQDKSSLWNIIQIFCNYIYIIYSEEENHLQGKVEKQLTKKKLQNNDIIWFRYRKRLLVDICTYNTSAQNKVCQNTF